MTRNFLSCAALMLLCCAPASAAIQINEIYFSPEDPKDDRQFFEISSSTGATSLSGLWLLELDGDLPIGGLLDNPGQVLNAFDLSSFSTGTNGLFLWRDSATVIDTSPAPGIQGPDPATVVHVEAFTQIFGYEETIGDDEDEVDVYVNNVHTFLLVSGFTGSVGDDLDLDEDGVLDAPLPWTSVVDGISSSEDGDPGYRYAAQVGGQDIELWFGADLFTRQPSDNMWILFDSGSGDGEPAGFQGPFFANDGAGPGDSDAGYADGTEIPVAPVSQFLYATPGAANVQIPEPATAVMLAMAALVLPRRRQR